MRVDVSVVSEEKYEQLWVPDAKFCYLFNGCKEWSTNNPYLNIWIQRVWLQMESISWNFGLIMTLQGNTKETYNKNMLQSTCGWVWTRTGLDRVENFAPTGVRYLGRPACGESLYRLSYTGPHLFATICYSCHGNSNILEYNDVLVSTG
jgi:hypothetical protein